MATQALAANGKVSRKESADSFLASPGHKNISKADRI